MEQELYGEWRRLEDEALAILEKMPERDGALAECHAVLLPSFDDCRSYTILVPPPTWSGQAIGVRRVWRRRDDLARFESPVIRLRYGPKLHPTIDEQDLTLPQEAVGRILERAADAKVPARIRHGMWGADGETYVLTFGGIFVSARYQWWCEPPDGWQVLEALLRDIASTMDSG